MITAPTITAPKDLPPRFLNSHRPAPTASPIPRPSQLPVIGAVKGEHKPLALTYWQRWMAWSGSFFVASILLHILLLGGAAMVVVHVMQGKKERMKFTAPPPAPPSQAEHKVKPPKKNLAPPTIAKRITSTALNVKIALPPIDLNTSTQADVMASVMKGFGSGKLSSAAGGGVGIASLPLKGLTAFGFLGVTGGGLVGHLYDLKQTADRKPTYTPGQSGEQKAKFYHDVLAEFYSKNWDETVFQRYFTAPEAMTAVQMYMPVSLSSGAAKAFNIEKETKDPNWVILYKGRVVAPETKTYRFIDVADDFMSIRFNGQTVIGSAPPTPAGTNTPPPVSVSPVLEKKANSDLIGIVPGRMSRKGIWFQVEKGKSYPIELLIGDTGGLYEQILMIQELNPSVPYPHSVSHPGVIALPIVQFRIGVPMPKYTPDLDKDYTRNPEFSPEPVLFLAK